MKKSFIIQLLFLSLLFSCTNVPDFPNTPAIVLKSIDIFPGVVQGTPNPNIDSIKITLSFQDGDGNLGLYPNDTLPPYNETNADGTPNPFHFNYFIDFFHKQNGVYVEKSFSDGFSFNGRFFIREEPFTQARPLEGDLDYTFAITKNGVFGSDIFDGDTILFEVQIADRDLNLSNKISTEDIILE